MNTRDDVLIEKIKDGSYYAIAPIVRQLVIDECLGELSKYAFTSQAFHVLRALKEQGCYIEK